MNSLSQSKAACKIKELARTLVNTRIKSDYSMSVSIYDATDSQKVPAVHKTSGSADCNLIKLIALVGAMSVVMSAVACACSIFKR